MSDGSGARPSIIRLMWAGAAAAMLAACSGSALDDAEADVRRYERADRAIVRAVDSASTSSAMVFAGPPPLDSPLWQAVALPDLKPGPVAMPDDEPLHAEVAWYRLVWRTASATADAQGDHHPVGLYIPRALGQGVQVWAHDGSRWSPIFDNGPHGREQWNRPLLVNVPDDDAARRRGVTLAVGLPFRNYAGNALSSVWVGRFVTLRERADWRRALHLGIPAAATLSMAVLGLLTFGVWLGRRREPVYLYFGLACVIWSVRNLHYFIDMPRGTDAFYWFWWLSDVSISWVMLAMYQFAFCFDHRRYPRLVQAFAAINVVATIVSAPLWNNYTLLVQHAVNIAASVFVTTWLTVLAIRGGSRELRVITAALWISTAFGVHDWLLLALAISPESIYLLPYASMLLIGSFLYAGMRRFIGAVAQAESANAVLASKLDERERELEANHDKLRRVEREQAVLLERQRIMRDMHDGVGSTLISTLRVVEQGGLSRDGLAELLRGTVDDLRMAIDSLEPIEHDLTTLLASLRSRMGRRLEAAGLRLHWDMADLPPLPWLDAPQAVQVLRLLQEALSNAIQHAQARSVRISAAVDNASVKVEVADDGVGLGNTPPSGGRGLANMRHRATALGGRLDLTAGETSGTVVRLWLPLRHGAGALPTAAG